jgi:hypothetical protein
MACETCKANHLEQSEYFLGHPSSQASMRRARQALLEYGAGWRGIKTLDDALAPFRPIGGKARREVFVKPNEVKRALKFAISAARRVDDGVKMSIRSLARAASASGKLRYEGL